MVPLAIAAIKVGVFLAWAFPTVSRTRRMLQMREQRRGIVDEACLPIEHQDDRSQR